MASKHSSTDIPLDPSIDPSNRGHLAVTASEPRNAGQDNSAKGGIVRSLLTSPLIGSDLDFSRDHTEDREIDL